MKIDFSKVLTDFRTGEEIMRQPATADAPQEKLTLGFCASEALLLQDGDATVDKQAVYLLAAKVFKGGEVELTGREVEQIKARIAAVYPSALISGQCAFLMNAV